MKDTLHPPSAVIVLAAGAGTRMRSRTPKPLHAVGGAPMLAHVLATARALRPDRVVVVVRDTADAVAAAARALDPDVVIAAQPGQRGTGEAARAALPGLDGLNGAAVVTFADAPLMLPGTLARLTAALADGAGVAVAGFEPADPGRYGRLALGATGSLERIVEAADATPDDLAIGLCNAGPMAFGIEDGRRWLDRLTADNAQGEYYLTDLISLARADGRRCAMALCETDEALGVNARAELAAAEVAFQARARRRAMQDGATLLGPETVWLAFDTQLGADVTVGPNVVFGPGVTVEDGATIGAFCHVEGCTVRADAVVGPFARLRPGADVGEGARVGNFVEIKNAVLGAGAKANHLAYVGDATVGAGVNIGAGAITCNYDGVSKHRTQIGEGAFIGSNSALVAPVTVGANAYVGSGSVITRDVEAGALAVGRARQVDRPGFAARLRARIGLPAPAGAGLKKKE